MPTEELTSELTRKITGLAGHWASLSALGTFLLYLVGYLSLRFHLAALGIPTDLSVLDERYFFEGANCLIFLATSASTLALLVLVLAIPVCLIGWLVGKTLSERAVLALKNRWERSRVWWSASGRLATAGIILAVLLIQAVMRQCFSFQNLLLRPNLPGPRWLRAILLETGNAYLSLYFAGLLAAVVATIGLLLAARRQVRQTEPVRLQIGLLTLLVLLQCALLPVNYGVLTAGRDVPRVQSPVPPADAWLVWDQKETMTFLLRHRDARGAETDKSLLTLPRENVKNLQILNHEPLLRALFVKAVR